MYQDHAYKNNNNNNNKLLDLQHMRQLKHNACSQIQSPKQCAPNLGILAELVFATEFHPLVVR